MRDNDLLRDARSLSRHSSRAHYAQAQGRRRTHRILRVVLVTVLAVIVAGGAAVWAYVNNLNSRLRGNLDNKLMSTLTTKEAGEPFYMLLLGVDKDTSRSSSKEYGSSSSAYRSDSIMLVRIDPQKKKVTMVSIPRDLKVDMGSHGTQKLNAAYSIGGASYAVKMVEKVAGVSISHYAEIDMDGMEDVVDAVGGVTVTLPVAVKDPNYTKLDLPAGKQKLDGKTAALLCRARHAYDSYGAGDFYRAANQRAVITAVAKKVLKSSLSTMTKTVNAMADMVNTDMSASDIVSLASQMRGMDTSKSIMSGLAPTEGKYIGGVSYEIMDDEAWQKMMKRVDAGKSPYSSSDQDPTAGVAAASGSTTTTTDDSDSSDDSSSGDESDSGSTKAEYSGSVTVLNGSGVNGLAGQKASELSAAGFQAQSGNANGPVSTTEVIYNGSDGLAKAKGVVKTLGLDVTPVANDGSYGSSQDVIVVLGQDQS